MSLSRVQLNVDRRMFLSRDLVSFMNEEGESQGLVVLNMPNHFIYSL